MGATHGKRRHSKVLSRECGGSFRRGKQTNTCRRFRGFCPVFIPFSVGFTHGYPVSSLRDCRHGWSLRDRRGVSSLRGYWRSSILNGVVNLYHAWRIVTNRFRQRFGIDCDIIEGNAWDLTRSLLTMWFSPQSIGSRQYPPSSVQGYTTIFRDRQGSQGTFDRSGRDGGSRASADESAADDRCFRCDS